jgi:carbonic anhydrase/acetyltransferase-like protein (isoleucine patch superfamily)
MHEYGVRLMAWDDLPRADAIVAAVAHGVIVNHDSSVGVNTFLSPAVVVCGDARIGDHCFIGAAAAIANDATVPDQGFVKMSACWTEGRA